MDAPRLTIADAQRIWSDRFQHAIKLAEDLGQHNLAQAMETMAQSAGLVAVSSGRANLPKFVKNSDYVTQNSNRRPMQERKCDIEKLVNSRTHTTLQDIARELKISDTYAQLLVYFLIKEGRLRKVGRGHNSYLVMSELRQVC